MNSKTVSGIMLVLLLIGITLFSILPLLSSVQLNDNLSYFVAYAKPSTQISGYITENTTWTLEESPYVVVEDVTVEMDVYLTVQPGVVVKFCEGTNLFIDGGLLAQGSSTNEIKFTSNNTTPKIGDWGTINLGHYSTAANRLNHVRIEYASTALTLAGDCNITTSIFELNNNGISLEDAGNVYLGYVQVANNTGVGISGSITNSIEMKFSRISMNGAGIAISGHSVTESNAELKNCAVDGNADYGVSFNGVKAQINNCNVSANGGEGISHSYPLKLRNSNISNNMGVGVSATLSTPDGESNEIENCTFLNNTNGLLICGYVTNCNINGNSGYGIAGGTRFGGPAYVYDCNITNNGEGILCGDRSKIWVYNSNILNNVYGIVGEPLSFVYVSNSIIRNNSETGVDGYNVDIHNSIIRDNSETGVDGWSVSTSGSEIINNTVGVLTSEFVASSDTVANNSLANIQTGTASMQYCSIYNSLIGIQLGSGTINQCDIYNHVEYNIVNKAQNDINATFNWWGTTNETFMDGHIFDYYDDSNLGRVLYKPYREAPLESYPVASFIYEPNEPVVYGSITFDSSASYDSDGSIVSYFWDFGDGIKVTETDPVTAHAYNNPGTYTVRLSVTDNEAHTRNSMKTITVRKALTFISISTSSSSTYLGFSVNITGILRDIYDTGLGDETVALYYTFGGIGEWVPLSSDMTDSLGNYFVVWVPPATGYFDLKAEWAGSETHHGTSNTTTLSSLVYEEQYVFSVESNSTISELAFNTKNWKLSFTASGPDGTMGYVKIYVAKSLVDDVANIRVFMDGVQSDFSIASLDNSWLLTFTYEHSIHQVEVNLDTTPPNILSISQIPPEGNVRLEDEVKVNANVIDEASGVKQVTMKYTNGDGTWTSVDMVNLVANVWNAAIPPFPFDTSITYVILAEDNAGNTVTSSESGYECQYQVIPEFSSWIILPLFLIVTLLVVLFKTRQRKNISC